jgi:hypothetical protein
MKVSDLQNELSKCDPDADIDIVVSIIEHSCISEEYCYCSYVDKNLNINNISKKTKYNKKTKQHDIVGFSIVGS